MAMLMMFMPESPYILITKGKEKRARKNLQWLRGPHYDIDGDIQEMKDTYAFQQKIGSISLQDLLSKAVYVKPFAIMMSLHAIQQFCGINYVVFYLSEIFLKAGFDIENSLQASSYVSLTQVSAWNELQQIFLQKLFSRRFIP